MKSIADTCAFGILLILYSVSALAKQPARDGETKYIGQYSNIVISEQSGDCDGFGLRLWSIKGTAAIPNMIGTWTEADGPCDKYVPIYDVRFNARTGELAFFTVNASQPGGEPGQFRGRLVNAALVGTFLWGGQPAGTPAVDVRLPQIPSGMGH